MGQPKTDFRIDGSFRRGPVVEIVVDGFPVMAFEGESVAAALLANGRRALRTTAQLQEPRGMYGAPIRPPMI